MRLDHLILGTPNLNLAASVVSTLLGCDPVAGGRHVGRGTANRLVSLGTGSYLELLGPDDDRAGATWIAPQTLGSGRLVGWALRSTNIERDAADLRRNGFDAGPVSSMQRESPQGLLEWRLTTADLEDGVRALPFLIDWGDSPHPSATLPPGPELLSLRVMLPDPQRLDWVAAQLEHLLILESSDVPRLEAVIRAADGRKVTLSELETRGEQGG